MADVDNTVETIETTEEDQTKNAEELETTFKWHYRKAKNSFSMSHLNNSLVEKCDELIALQGQVIKEIEKLLKDD